MKKPFYLLLILFVSSCSSLKPTMSGTFTDKRDGNVYKWVKLKNQIWMAQNLDYDTEGTLYETQKGRKEIGNLYMGRYIKNLAPEGWHMPSDAEWQELEIAAGMTKEEAEANGARGIVSSSFIKGGSTKFNILFTGVDNYKSNFTSKEKVVFWTSTPALKSSYLVRLFWTNDDRIDKSTRGTSESLVNAAYVRCVKNDTLTTGLTVEYDSKKRK